jgi:hypothetical protein
MSPFSGFMAWPLAVDRAGRVVGFSLEEYTTYAVAWPEGRDPAVWLQGVRGGPDDELPGFDYPARAFDLNERGTVVGSITLPGWEQRAVLWQLP